MADALVTLQLRLPDLDQSAGRTWLDDLLTYLAQRPGPTPRVQAQTVGQTESASDGLTALLIDHRHGTDLTLHPTHDAAKVALVRYVRTWWARELPDEPEPADDDEAVSCYFDRIEDEDKRIEPANLQPASDPTRGATAAARCQVCGRRVTHPADGPWLHDWSKSNSCDPEDPDGPVATPFWQTPSCRRCGSPLSTGGTCQALTCPYADRQQYQSFTEG
jgi:hypothetical protein